MQKPIDLYYWPTPNGWKISIALEEMGLPYTIKPVNIGRGEQFADTFLERLKMPPGFLPQDRHWIFCRASENIQATWQPVFHIQGFKK